MFEVACPSAIMYALNHADQYKAKLQVKVEVEESSHHANAIEGDWRGLTLCYS